MHEHREYTEGCIDIICEEWGRSRTVRLLKVMLEKSCPTLPYNIVLILRSNSSRTKVVGHSRLSIVLNKKNFAFVETVVVSKSHRGKGLGRKLMEETEKHALKLGIETLCLTTLDKQDFYRHLG
uniref:N-acetyltransferase domain-containing protein n=1 Tax=Helobdella robusta TaxID=6412 RepID=T1EH71_HELRO